MEISKERREEFYNTLDNGTLLDLKNRFSKEEIFQLGKEIREEKNRKEEEEVRIKLAMTREEKEELRKKVEPKKRCECIYCLPRIK